MLGLFKEEQFTLPQSEIYPVLRRLLASSLNKGIIPRWDEFFKELPVLDSAEDLELLKNRFSELVEWPFLKDILALEGNEFFFHGPKNSQRLLENGTKLSIEVGIGLEDWQLWLEIMTIKFHQNWNVQNPFVSFYAELFGQTYRLSFIHSSTSPLGISKLVIRKLASTPFDLASFGETTHLKSLVKEKKNFLVAGSTGSGKTSLLTSLINEVEPQEHLVILEDTYEILCQHEHQTRLLSGNSAETSLKAYLSYSLRLSPDRIILGEMRSHEVVPFVMAMNTGHRGLMGTIHASSGHDALNRLALLFSLYGGEANLSYDRVMELICRNLEYVVYMENKQVKEVIKVLGSDQGTPFFEAIHRV